MKTIIYLLLGCFCSGKTLAQQFSPQSAGSLGQAYTGGQYTLEDHIGSISVNTLYYDTIMCTQGFLQPIRQKTRVKTEAADTGSVNNSNNLNASSTPINGRTIHPGTVAALPVTGQEYVVSRLNREAAQQTNRKGYDAVKREEGENKEPAIKVWPMPAKGFFNVQVNGLDKTGMVLVIHLNGKLLKQLPVQNNSRQQVSGLPAGTYMVTLAAGKTIGQKVIVQ